MKHLLQTFFVIMLVVVLAVASMLYMRMRKQAVPSAEPASVPSGKIRQEGFIESPLVGEELVYDVKMGSIRLGSAVFRRLPSEMVGGMRLQVMSFETDLARFKDTELIYSDPETFLPVRVERDIRNWLSREKITEYYDQQAHTLTVVKHKGTREEKVVLEKDGAIQHPILLPHYVRGLPKLEVGERFQVTLPKRAFSIAITAIEDVVVPVGDFKAYRFESTPRQIAIWISADEKRLPLKIQGVGVFNYVFVLKGYRAPAVPAPASGVTYSRARVCIGGRCVEAQVADTPEKKSLGLMHRDSLREGEGMLFVYDKPDTYSFWMKNMLIPLDIIWISEGLKVVEVMRDVPPCKDGSECIPFSPEQPAQYILEVSAGSASKLRIKAGQGVTF